MTDRKRGAIQSGASRNVLLIAPSFPPQNHIGVYRAYRLAKELPRYGWRPHVLTVDRNYVNREDPALLSDMPAEVTIHRARYVEPTLRGVRAQFGQEVMAPGSVLRDDVQTATGHAPTQHANPVARAYRSIQGEWLMNPDAYATWRLPALRMARDVMARNQIDLVWTTTPEYSGPSIGAQLQREGATWVADFQDPVTYLSYLRSTRERVERQQRRIEAIAVQQADALTGASQGIGMILEDMYGGDVQGRYRFIPFGLDTSLLQRPSETPGASSPYLIFPGMMFPQYGPAFLEALAEALTHPGVAATGVHFLVVGDKERNTRYLLPDARRLGIEDRVVLMDYVPQQDVLRLIQGALGGVLLTGRTARWWCLHAKQVEYMGLRRRVVALVPEVSEARLHLQRTGLGVFLDGDCKRAGQTLADFILGRLELPAIDEAECDRFTARSQADSFASLFEYLVERDV